MMMIRLGKYRRKNQLQIWKFEEESGAIRRSTQENSRDHQAEEPDPLNTDPQGN